jgi:superfamily II DNA/RNA helicase
VLPPTRELAIQIADSFSTMAAIPLDEYRHYGVSTNVQVQQLQRGVTF